MSNSTVNLPIFPVGKGGRAANLPVDAGSHIYAGTLVSQLDATSMLVPGSTALSGPAIGISTHEQDATSGSDGDKRCIVITDVVVALKNAAAPHACSEAVAFGAVVYMQDDHTISADSNTGAYFAAGTFVGMEEDGRVRVYIPMRRADTDPLESDLSTTAGAGLVGILDAGTFTSATTVEGALAEIYQGMQSIQKQVNIPLLGSIDATTGTAMIAFVDGAYTVPGTEFTNSKTCAVRWNNHATPTALVVNVAMPQDLDDTAVVTFHALVSKVGATSGDATKLTVGAFEHTVAALHDADTDFGGDTSAVVGNATSKTVTEVTLTLAAADVHATPSSMCFTIKPKAGTLGTDDLLLHSAWLEYKGKILTS